jgi:transcriptional antiterminator NusG
MSDATESDLLSPGGGLSPGSGAAMRSRGPVVTARWYVIHVYSGFEKKVAQSIREQSQQKGMAEQFQEVLVPLDSVLEVRKGNKKVAAERKFFPGYVLVKMEMNDQTWHLVKNTPKVTGFLGAKAGPVPITDAEAERLLRQIKEGVERPRPSITFEVGEQVRVCDGPFTSFNGMVEEVDEEKARLKVSVSIFGRPTPVDLEYSQVEKV